jgi:predicted TIM-barrel fold metal-dependent hydrolase
MTPRPAPIDRRTFLKLGALGASTLAGESAALTATADTAPAIPRASAPVEPIVDVNVSLSRWPFRRLSGDETSELVTRLRERGVVEAWAGSFDALLHRDTAAVNARLADECRKHDGIRLVPFGSINPMLPDWEDDLRRCQDEHGMPGIRLHPNYHGYTLDDADFLRLLELASARQLIVQFSVTMEDERTQHPLLRVPHVDATPLVELSRRFPGLRLMLLNAFRKYTLATLKSLEEPANISFEFATLEMVGAVGLLIEKVGVDRVLFGSNSPFYYFESAALKLKESSLNAPQRLAIISGNARKLVKSS